MKIPAKILTQWVPAFGILGVMLYYALFLYRHALNIPYNDDIFDVLTVLNRIVQSNGLKSIVAVLFELHLDHRNFSSRLVYYLLLFINGEVNFRDTCFLREFGDPVCC